MRLPALFATCLIACAAHAQEPKPPCPPKDTACARAVAAKHPAKQATFWQGALAKPLEQRIGPAPKELIELLAVDNVANGYPNKPRAPQLTDRFIADVKRMYAEIPEAIRRKVEPQLAGIYFVDDIGGTGFTDEIFDRSGGKPLGVIVLDPSVLTSRTANAWATWKDNTPFKPDAAWALSERIEDAARDDAAHAIQYILLHEIGHVLSIGRRVHPSWTVDVKTLSSTREYAYFNLSWTIRDGGYVPLPALDFPNRRNVAFYFGAKLEASAMTETYSGLEQTNFPTLYAATHPGDDFADAFANYVHVVMLGRPYEIRITHEGRVVKAYVSCWKQERCAAKRRLLEELVQ